MCGRANCNGTQTGYTKKKNGLKNGTFEHFVSAHEPKHDIYLEQCYRKKKKTFAQRQHYAHYANVAVALLIV